MSDSCMNDIVIIKHSAEISPSNEGLFQRQHQMSLIQIILQLNQLVSTDMNVIGFYLMCKLQRTDKATYTLFNI